MDSNQIEPDVKSCGVIVFRQEPEFSFLLMRHADRWDLPKGHVDPGETEVETALRELHEETGISFGDVELDDRFRFTNRYTVRKKRYGMEPRLKELVIFLGRLVTPVELALTEHIGFEWFRWDPPHQIQNKSIDPLLSTLDRYWSEAPLDKGS